MNKDYLLEELEDVEDTRILNMLKGSFREKKVVPRFRGKVDMKRYKVKYNVKYNDVAGGSVIDIKNLNGGVPW